MQSLADKVGDIAHLFTGSVSRSCCYITGGYNANPQCECRDLAETVIENIEKIKSIVDG